MADENVEDRQARWRRLEEIYHAALPLSLTERAAYVARACAGDAELHEEVASLLEADDAVGTFLREPAVELGLSILAGESSNDTEIMSSPPIAADLNGATVAGRYEVIERLGGGGFGDVYKALDMKIMSRPVVIKVLKDEVWREEGVTRDWLLTKFRQEIEALSRIRDPGVVGIFDADTLPDGRPYLVMEFVGGPDLRHFVKKATAGEGLGLEEVAEIVKQIGRTLTTAHDEKIIHRDLKPENIMLRHSASGDLQVKVIDFGIAKVRNSLIAPSTATGRFMAGTWGYMAPEQLQGKKVSAASDIYAFGVIAYELVTGRHPFAAKDPVDIKNLQEGGVKIKPCDLNPELPAAAQAAILQALSFYSSERQQRARDLGDELARALTAEEELRPAPPLAGLRKGWLFAAIVVLLGVVIGLIAWRYSGEVGPLPPTTTPGAETPPDARPERTLTYWLTVRRKHDREPFPSIGEKIFDAGSEFWFNIQVTQSGALYLFSEGKNDNHATEWNTMFPTRDNNRGSPWLQTGPARVLRTEGYVFAGRRGTVKVWVIWAKEAVESLDKIVKSSYDTEGVIREPAQLRDFIERHRAPLPEVIPDRDLFRVTLKGRGDVLVDLRELEYQP